MYAGILESIIVKNQPVTQNIHIAGNYSSAISKFLVISGVKSSYFKKLIP
jgi:hypothetical protein